ncbi:MAG: flavodoxin-dependent (E)-4-hydroxy-3-methylbut-2-enyl-diphosphate synthase [Mycoplasmataceae bacterium]|nr:flavodoxin-dependent (E)-4-hydroxy-3-methylbut-2-enyl-diphosphate synthase [Mycoplasmataceae bacterium]
MFLRTQTKKIMVGGVQIGHSNHVVIQSMTNTKTSNINQTLKQIKNLFSIGCELVRVAILDTNDSSALNKIIKLSPCPIIADIHYNYKFAIDAINAGVSGIRINPANIKLTDLKKVVESAKKNKIIIRIGVNQGSTLNNKEILSTKQLINLTQKYVSQFEKWGFYDIVISLKSSNPFTTQQLYLQAAKIFKYPLHVGVTEAGSKTDAVIKSTTALIPILQKGIGNTIRISITGNPLQEISICKKILKQVNLYKNVIEIISCPTCGRLSWSLENLLSQVEEYTKNIDKQLKIAIMGCSVNGIGECLHSDIGVYGTNDKLIVYLKGKKYSITKHNDGFKTIKSLINKFVSIR